VNGLPGCPHAGFPIIICNSGSYRLSGNISVSDVNTTAILIVVTDVTVDLNGFTISGPVTCTDTDPVQCSGSGQGNGIADAGSAGINNVTIINGTIRGMGNSGIGLSGEGALREL
jgi:hypothetical protein